MKILLADDDADMVDWLGYSFRKDGYTVLSAYNGEAALRLFSSDAPDVVVLDMMMPKKNGLEVLAEIRRHSRVPIILLTAVGDEEHIVQALKSGADDYVVKPFRPRELRARVETVLRRAQPAEFKAQGPLTCGEISLDARSREVQVSGRPVQLSRTEFHLLEYLLLNQGRVVPISEALSQVWGYDAEQNEDMVRVTILRLRRKIEPDSTQPSYIHNVPGEGYVLRAPDPKGKAGLY